MRVYRVFVLGFGLVTWRDVMSRGVTSQLTRRETELDARNFLEAGSFCFEKIVNDEIIISLNDEIISLNCGNYSK